ncbi:MAG: acyl-CoA dehydrogenase family protein [Steroidobacteraceae bacterium]|nr:acyl-CoA dehydrogenase family protein [Steroidobacteraceae bacterium]
MELDLTSKQRAFRDEVRRFLEANLSPHLRNGARATPTVFAEPEIGREWQDILYRRGWLAYNWPQEYGGTGWSPLERYIFEKECALADAPALAGMGLKLLGPVLYTFGSEAQKTHYLPRILSGEHYWCQGFSEPSAGSDLASLKTRAERTADGYLVNGGKLWTTHAQFATHMFCLARTDASVKPQRGISFLLLNMKDPGVTVRPIRGLAGDYEVNEVFLKDVLAPADDLVGEEGQGWSIAKFLLENERGGSCLAPRLLADIVRLRAAHGFGRSSLFALRLAEVELEAQALEVTELRILAQLERGEKPGPQSSLVKLVGSRLRQQIDALVVQSFGYGGLQLTEHRPLYDASCPEPLLSKDAQIAMPRYLNGRSWSIFGGANEIQRTIIARSVLQL